MAVLKTGFHLQTEEQRSVFTLRGEDGLIQTTVVPRAAPVIQDIGDPVTQSEDRHRGEVQPGQNLLPGEGKDGTDSETKNC